MFQALNQMGCNKLHAIGIFWQDKLNPSIGIEVTLKKEDGNLEKILEEVQKGYFVYLQHPEVTPAEYIDQLRDIAHDAQQGNGYTFEHVTIAMMNIYYLEKIGVIQSDNFNGLVYMYGQ